jgi:hypothetical protein
MALTALVLWERRTSEERFLELLFRHALRIEFADIRWFPMRREIKVRTSSRYGFLGMYDTESVLAEFIRATLRWHRGTPSRDLFPREEPDHPTFKSFNEIYLYRIRTQEDDGYYSSHEE